MDSKIDLEQKLTSYNEQLKQVLNILAANPASAEFLKLKEDLEKVIGLTYNLLQLHDDDRHHTLSSSSASAISPSSTKYSNYPVDVNGNEGSSGNGSYLEATVDYPSESNGGGRDHNDDNNDENANSDDDAESSLDDVGEENHAGHDGIVGEHPHFVAVPEGPLRVGECVEVLGGDRPYAAVLTALTESEGGETNNTSESTCRVKYFEFEAEVQLPLSSLVRIARDSQSVLHPEDVQVGQKGVYTCKYGADQQYYEAIVTALTAAGCLVKYPAYGNAEEVPLAYLRCKVLPIAKKDRGVAAKGTAPLAPLSIPDNLKILPTDTEEVCVCVCVCTLLCILYSMYTTPMQ